MIDGLLLYHLKDELQHKLNNARLERMIQLDDFSFQLTFYRYGEKLHLIINVHPNDFAIYLSAHKHQKAITTQFSQSLKKALSGAILTSVTQHLTDRVIILQFIVNDLIEGPIQKELIFEAMGKYSNLIITSQHKIIDTYKKMFFDTGRQLLPHANFEFFPSDKKPFTHFSFEHIKNPKDITMRYMGLSTKTALHLFEHHIKPLDLTKKPTLDIDKNDVYFCDIFDLEHDKAYFPTISALFDRPKKEHKKSKTSYALFIEKQLKKLLRKDDQLHMQREQNEQKLLAKHNGDAIYQSLLPLQEKHSSICINDMTIALDPTKTLNENAQLFYQIYQKAKRGIKPIEEQIAANQQLIDLFHTYQTYLVLSEDQDLEDLADDLATFGYKTKHKPQKQKKNHKPNIMKIVDEKATYILGKNDAQNTYITHQIAHSNDMWFHVKDAPGTHLIVQTNVLNEAIIRKAAMLAAYHSSLSLSSSIPVDYTYVKYIKKIPKLPGFHVSYTHQKTIFIDIDEDKIKDWIHM